MRAGVFALAVAAAVPAAAQPLDFQVYRSSVEPIFLKMRTANGPGGPCFSCHTHLNTRFRLEPLHGDVLAWTEAESRKNFAAVSRLVTPGEPQKSTLLLHPLATSAGGDPLHAGGKHWASRDDPEWQAIAGWVKSASAGGSTAATPSLDFDAFKATVQPIFLKKRPGHARCYVCHSQGTNFRLEPLAPGSTTWDEQASRRNFEAVRRLVVPGDPQSSRLLMQPLASDAGGDPFHPGGKHWTSKDDPEWRAVAAWVRGRSTQ